MVTVVVSGGAVGAFYMYYQAKGAVSSCGEDVET